MIHAERHHKLVRDSALAHRGEDLLTSSAFQLLWYLPPTEGLLAVLKRVRSVRLLDGNAVAEVTPPAWALVDTADDFEYTFWPNWRIGFGQPELVVTFTSKGQSVGRILFEVKLDSGKSQTMSDAIGDDGPDEDEADPDQLSKYWRGLQKDLDKTGGPALGVVYLTAHAIPPLADLTESLARQPGTWLGWLSWWDVWAAMNAVRNNGRPFRPAADLADLLALKGFKTFDGFHVDAWFPPSKPWQFWETAEGVTMPGQELSRSVAEATHFLWRIHRQVWELLGSLEKAFDARGWVRELPQSDRDRVVRDHEDLIAYKVWLAWSLWRLFAPVGTTGGGSEQYVGVQVIFGPDDPEEYPSSMLLIVAARFEESVNAASVWKSWNWDHSEVALRAARDKPHAVRLTGAQSAQLFPGAREAVALVIPLCELTGSADLEARVVAPILAAEAALGSTPPAR